MLCRNRGSYSSCIIQSRKCLQACWNSPGSTAWAEGPMRDADAPGAEGSGPGHSYICGLVSAPLKLFPQIWSPLSRWHFCSCWWSVVSSGWVLTESQSCWHGIHEKWKWPRGLSGPAHFCHVLPTGRAGEDKGHEWQHLWHLCPPPPCLQALIPTSHISPEKLSWLLPCCHQPAGVTRGGSRVHLYPHTPTARVLLKARAQLVDKRHCHSEKCAWGPATMHSIRKELGFEVK